MSITLANAESTPAIIYDRAHLADPTIEQRVFKCQPVNGSVKI